MSTAPAPLSRRILLAPAILAAVKLVIPLLIAAEYGIFRDELYYISCSKRLDWGYVDQPPLSIALLALQRLVLPDTPRALLVLPALAGAAMVYLVGSICSRMGGKGWAPGIASLGALAAPVYIALHGFFSMNALDLLFWTLAAWALVRVIEEPTSGRWALLGVILGLGLQNKLSMLWFGAGLAVALIVTAQRRALRTPGPYLAAGLAFLIASPYLLWQVAHGWPTLEFMRNATGRKMVSVSPLTFLGDQLLAMNPLEVPLWLGGLLWLLLAPSARRWRPLAVIFLAVFAILISGGKARMYYLSPAYVPLLAAGGIALSRGVARHRWLVATYLAAIASSGLLLAPLGAPLLPPDVYVRYARTLGVGPRAEEHSAVGALPQVLADRFGWRELASDVAAVVATIAPGERESARIYTTNYGRAGAIELYGVRDRLPRVISGHNNWYLWGPGEGEPAVIVIVGGRIEDHRGDFDDVMQVSTHHCEWCMPYENEVPIFVGRGLKEPVAKLWPATKDFN